MAGNGDTTRLAGPEEGSRDLRRLAGRYELLRLLGRGGMGDVHLARDTKFDRLVAIKLFRDAGIPGARDRFLKEAGFAGRLVHPHIVTVYDFGEHDGDLYMAMEYIAGDSLAQLISRRLPRTLQEKLTLMTDLCAGLGYAHDAGVLHRDIKPANLMLAPSGILKIVDFGIARALESHTMTLPFTGSLYYMSPEQLTWEPLDERSDIFAVGAVFYELLSFQQAFAAESVDAVVDKIRSGSPEPLSNLCPDLAPSVVAVVGRALEKDRNARFQDLHSMGRELRAIARSLPMESTASASTDVNVARGLGEEALGEPSLVSPIDARDRWARAQARLLDPAARRDYAVAGLAGAIPLAVAWVTGAFRDITLPVTSPLYEICVAIGGGSPVVAGYASRLNWWPFFALLPFVLFVLRRTATYLFPLGIASREVGILRRIDPAGRPAVAARLAAAACDPRNLKTVLAIAFVANVIDLRETATHYAIAIGNGTGAGCPREFDWTVAFLADPSMVSVGENVLLVLAAYPCQFLAHSLALMLFVLLFRHNVVYLAHIYQRNRARRRPVTEEVVLDFEDVERCFGLRALHSTFNYEVVLLIAGGLIILSSRLMNVDATPLGFRYERALAAVLFTATPAPPAPALQRIAMDDLFPDAGQVMLGIVWMACFVIVAMPSAVKFLPLLHKHITLVGRREYLLEFIPPATDVRAGTQEEVDALARKFARSSFWPAGDERARTLYTIAFFVFFIVLVPAPPTSRLALVMHGTAVFMLSYLCMKVTFWLFRKTLATVDATLAQA